MLTRHRPIKKPAACAAAVLSVAMLLLSAAATIAAAADAEPEAATPSGADTVFTSDGGALLLFTSPSFTLVSPLTAGKAGLLISGGDMWKFTVPKSKVRRTTHADGASWCRCNLAPKEHCCSLEFGQNLGGALAQPTVPHLFVPTAYFSVSICWWSCLLLCAPNIHRSSS
jgi:hypothetical protein